MSKLLILPNIQSVISIERQLLCLIFLDISKAFDRVWHEGLLFKLKCYGIKGSLLTLIKSFYQIGCK